MPLITAPSGRIITIPTDCGYIPDPERQAERDCSERPYVGELGAASTSEDIVQPLGFKRSQESAPSCTGQTGAGMYEFVQGPGHPIPSAIGPWLDARFREGRAHVVGGTYLFLVMESLVRRGVETRRPDEDTNTSMWTRAINDQGLRDGPGLDAEMEASDRKIAPLDRRRIADTERYLLDAIDAALHAKHGVGKGTDVDTPYQLFHGAPTRSVPEDHCLGLEAIGTRGAGHAQRIAGMRRRRGRRQYLLANSWSEFWGLTGWWWYQNEMVRLDHLTRAEAIALGAEDLSGCVWVDESVITSPRSRDFQVLMSITRLAA